MIEVTDTLKDILIAQGRRTIEGQTAVLQILEEVRKQVLMELISVPQIDNTTSAFSARYLRSTLIKIDDHLATFEAEAKTKLGAYITASWKAGAMMLPDMVSASGITTGFGISRNLLEQLDPWLKNMEKFTWGLVEGLTADAAAKIKAELCLGVLGQKSTFEVAQAIAGNLPNELPTFQSGKTIFANVAARAEVITMTEMGRAFSMATQAALESAADTLPNLQKMWLHAGHPKVARRFHKDLNGEIKPVTENFLVGNISMMYPRDPKAPASEVIRCGCMHTGYLPEFGTTEEILKSWQDAQDVANSPIKKQP